MHSPTIVDLVAQNQALQAALAAREATLASQCARIVELQIKVTERDSEVIHLSTWIEKLKLQIAVLKRLRFGRSSEKLDQEIVQLELIVDELEAQQGEHQQANANPADVEPPAAHEPTVQRARKLMPDHLPRQVVNHAPACSCPTCGGNHLRLVGETVSEQLELIPEHFKVIRHVRGKYSCAGCQTMVQAPAPSRPLIKSPVAPGLLAHVLVSKYMDHLPLHRQSEIYARQGVELERATLANWVGGASTLLRPLLNAIQTHTLSATKVHADDTPVPVLQPGRKTTKQGRIWAYVRDDRNWKDPTPPSVWFAYSPDRKGVHPQKHLKDFKGTIQSDGYQGYNQLYEKPQIHEAACWAHARRKFDELAEATGSPAAKQARLEIAKLYAMEKLIKGKDPDERFKVRQELALPLLASFKDWLTQTYAQTSKQSALGKAIAYSLNRWEALMLYVGDGRIEIDNNAVERQIRPIALGRKNYLFAGSDNGGERAAAIYSILGTAKMHGLNPEAYLKYVFERINDHKVNEIHKLLPWNVPQELKLVADEHTTIAKSEP